jgi:serine/threonine protein kinase
MPNHGEGKFREAVRSAAFLAAGVALAVVVQKLLTMRSTPAAEKTAPEQLAPPSAPAAPVAAVATEKRVSPTPSPSPQPSNDSLRSPPYPGLATPPPTSASSTLELRREEAAAEERQLNGTGRSARSFRRGDSDSLANTTHTPVGLSHEGSLRGDFDDLDTLLERDNKINELKHKVLKRVAPVRSAPENVQDFLVDNMQYDVFNAGEVFCNQGDYGDTMFIIAFGKAEGFVDDKMVAVFRDGDFFGEVAALQGALRTATVTAVTRTIFFTITREVILECIAQHPPMKLEFEKRILQRKIERRFSVAEKRQPEVQRLIRDTVQQELAEFESKSRRDLVWKKNRRIGGGAFGEVYSAIDTRTGEPLAVKIIQMGEISDAMLVSLERESEIMERLHHPNVVRGYGLQRDPEHGRVHIIMELVPLGSLQKLLHEFGPLSEAAARTYASQMLHGLRYLHSEGILHRDIKPANALIGADGCIKLADFGISRLGLQHKTQTISGTPAYMAPDAINGRYSVASDVWAFGCTVLELITGQQPWSHLGLDSGTQLIFAIAMRSEPHPIPDYISPQLRDFFAITLSLEADRRGPDCATLLKHPWFSVPAADLPPPPPVHNGSFVASGSSGQYDDNGDPTAQITSLLVQLQSECNSIVSPASTVRSGPPTLDRPQGK